MKARVEPEAYANALARAHYRCERCGAQHGLELHHVLGRQPPVLVNDGENLMMLCKTCHGWWHANKRTALRWCAETFGADRLARLTAMRRGSKHARCAQEGQ